MITKSKRKHGKKQKASRSSAKQNLDTVEGETNNDNENEQTLLNGQVGRKQAKEEVKESKKGKYIYIHSYHKKENI